MHQFSVSLTSIAAMKADKSPADTKDRIGLFGADRF
jgi:hypothetical protein